MRFSRASIGYEYWNMAGRRVEVCGAENVYKFSTVPRKIKVDIF